MQYGGDRAGEEERQTEAGLRRHVGVVTARGSQRALAVAAPAEPPPPPLLPPPRNMGPVVDPRCWGSRVFVSPSADALKQLINVSG